MGSRAEQGKDGALDAAEGAGPSSSENDENLGDKPKTRAIIQGDALLNA